MGETRRTALPPCQPNDHSRARFLPLQLDERTPGCGLRGSAQVHSSTRAKPSPLATLHNTPNVQAEMIFIAKHLKVTKANNFAQMSDRVHIRRRWLMRRFSRSTCMLRRDPGAVPRSGPREARCGTAEWSVLHAGRSEHRH